MKYGFDYASRCRWLGRLHVGSWVLFHAKEKGIRCEVVSSCFGFETWGNKVGAWRWLVIVRVEVVLVFGRQGKKFDMQVLLFALFVFVSHVVSNKGQGKEKQMKRWLILVFRCRVWLVWLATKMKRKELWKFLWNE